MRLRVQVIVEADDETPPAVHEVAHVERDELRVETLGLHLTEAKDLLQKVQQVVITEPVRSYVGQQLGCPECGRARRHKDATTIAVRTLFGTLHVPSPRWWHCSCRPQPTRTFSPLATTQHCNAHG